jgi:hypothetical protein
MKTRKTTNTRPYRKNKSRRYRRTKRTKRTKKQYKRKLTGGMLRKRPHHLKNAVPSLHAVPGAARVTPPLTAEANRIKLWETFFIAKAALETDKLSDFSDEYIVRVHKLCLELFKNIVTFKICISIIQSLQAAGSVSTVMTRDILLKLREYRQYLVIGTDDISLDSPDVKGMKEIITEMKQLDKDTNQPEGYWKIYWEEFYKFAYMKSERWNEQKTTSSHKDRQPENSITNIYHHLYYKFKPWFPEIITILKTLLLDHDSSEYMWEKQTTFEMIERYGVEERQKVHRYYNLFTGKTLLRRPNYV